MPFTLLAQKLFLPTLPEKRLVRTPLLRRLDEGLAGGRAVTLISAPAGYGKSTLAAEWATRSPRPAAWLSLDEADDTPRHFFAYLIAALQRIDPAVGAGIQPVLAAGQTPPPPALMAELINDLTALETPCLCVLDDFQSIQDQAILQVLQGMLAHQPAAFHLVLVTREDPALPLARLRASNQLTEIRAADLRFDRQEVQRFLHEGMGVALAEADLAELTERTEGWVAGLQLAGLSMQGRPDPSSFVQSLSGSHRFILSYLTEEVLKAQPPEVQSFLLHTAILSRLTGDLCDAVAGQTGSAALLEELLAANLFLVPLDDEGRWYRYHHLFADLLRHQLQRSRPEIAATLHRRAAGWYEKAGIHGDAIEHSLAGEDHTRSVALLETHGWKLLNLGLARRMEAWIGSLPAHQREASPRINLDFAWMHLLRGHFGAIAPHLHQAQTALAQQERDDPAAADLRAECLALQANLLQVQNRIDESLDAARQSLALASPANAQVISLASLALGAAYRLSGQYPQAVAALEQAIGAAQETGNGVTEMLALAHLTSLALQYGRLRFVAQVTAPYQARLGSTDAPLAPVVGSAQIALAALHYWWNRLAEARAFAEEGARVAALSGHTASGISARLVLSQILQAEGDLPGAAAAVEEAGGLLAGGAPGWLRLDVLARQAELHTALDRTEAAEAILGQTGIGATDPVTHATDRVHLAWLRLLAVTDPAAARDLARRVVASALAGERHGTAIQALVVAALLATAPDEAISCLERAVTLAEPEGNVRAFVDGGPATLPLLKRGGHTRLLAHFSPGGEGPPDQRGLIEPLSERELEVLTLLGQGLKYAEIADALVVSLNTVRFHVKSIYGKLGVNRQAHAVQRARELGLI